MKKLPYKEGDWFAVPLGDDRYGVGLIARAAPKGRVLLGYFFDRFFRGVPTLSDVADLTPDKAVEIIRFGDLSLFKGEWPILGPLPDWDRSRWPMPLYIGRDLLVPRAWRVEYSDHDPNRVVRRERVPPDTAGIGSDSLYGAGAVEITLRKLMEKN